MLPTSLEYVHIFMTTASEYGHTRAALDEGSGFETNIESEGHELFEESEGKSKRDKHNLHNIIRTRT